MAIKGQRPGAEGDDYRPAADSHADGKSYKDRGAFGTYQVREDDFPDPANLKRATGWGATTEDLRRGFVRPSITDNPAYEKSNYELRSSLPRREMDGGDSRDRLNDDGSNIFDDADYSNFRDRNMVAKGFLTRPRYSKER
jgi:hypothetical protein